MVRTEGARLGLAHTAASESHATSALADERRIVQRRSQDDPAPCEHERGRPEDHREALDGPTQDHGEAQHGQAQDGQARDRETDHREAKDDAPSQRWALDREAHDAPHLGPQEAPLEEA
ncbi:MAG: hypothetical protein ACRDG6_12080 [Candidatus Limnocylindria bacterium]